MKKKFLYEVQWAEQDGSGWSQYKNFVVATDDPSKAIVQILASSVAREMKGRISNFRGPCSEVWSDS